MSYGFFTAIAGDSGERFINIDDGAMSVGDGGRSNGRRGTGDGKGSGRWEGEREMEEARETGRATATAAGE